MIITRRTHEHTDSACGTEWQSEIFLNALHVALEGHNYVCDDDSDKNRKMANITKENACFVQC
jgi:hypothetical protein